MSRHLIVFLLAALGLSGAFGSLARAQSAAGDEVGYSEGATRVAPGTDNVREKTEHPGAAPEKAAAPKLSITLEGYEKKDEPPAVAPAPVRDDLDMEAVSPVVPEASRAPERQTSTPPRPTQKTAPQPSVTNAPRPAVPPARPSPVLSMLESTLRGNYNNTRAIARNMPGKHFDRVGDKSLAKKFSKQGNDLLNKQDNPPAALAAYQSAYENDPSSSEITGSYGYTLFRNGRFAEARDMEMECLEIAPDYAAAWFVLGQIYGYLQQEDMAYASFVNTCLFTKNLSTSLGFLEREMKKYGEVTVQRAAARALDACRRLPAGATDPGAVSSRPAPSEPEPLGGEALERRSPPGADSDKTHPAPAATAAGRWKNARIGKVDIQTAIMESRYFQNMIAKMAKLPKAQIDAWLDSQIGPVITELHGVIRTYASANNYLLVIQSKDEDKVRRASSLRTAVSALVEDDGFAAFLDSPEGSAYRKKAPIQDLTSVVAERLGMR